MAFSYLDEELTADPALSQSENQNLEKDKKIELTELKKSKPEPKINPEKIIVKSESKALSSDNSNLPSPDQLVQKSNNYLPF